MRLGPLVKEPGTIGIRLFVQMIWTMMKNGSWHKRLQNNTSFGTFGSFYD
jgi:hypothetical protein